MLYGINTETLECLICISWYYRIIDEIKYLKFAKNENNLLYIKKEKVTMDYRDTLKIRPCDPDQSISSIPLTCRKRATELEQSFGVEKKN